MTKKEPHVPWKPPSWEEADAYAIRAVMTGEASPDQQKRAMDWIIKKLCGTYDMVYHSASDRDTVFAAAKQFVGQQIVAMPQKLLIVKTARREKDEHA